MGVLFQSIFGHLQLQIIEKLTSTDFVRLQKSSLGAFLVSKQLRKRLPLEADIVKLRDRDGRIEIQNDDQPNSEPTFIDGIPVRLSINLISLDQDVTDVFCQNIVRFFRSTRSSARSIIIVSTHLPASPESFNSLLEGTGAGILDWRSPNPPEFYRQPALRQCQELTIVSALNDDDLLALKAVKLEIQGANVTATGINRLIKEWWEGKRVIANYNIVTSHDLNSAIVLPNGVRMEGTQGEFCIENKESTEELSIIFIDRWVALMNPDAENYYFEYMSDDSDAMEE